MTYTAEQMREIYEELPTPVQVSLVSLSIAMRHRTWFAQDYPAPTAQYLQATGFFDITLDRPVHEKASGGFVRLKAFHNENSQTLFENRGFIFFEGGVE